MRCKAKFNHFDYEKDMMWVFGGKPKKKKKKSDGAG